MPELIRSPFPRPSPQGEGVRKRPSTRGEGAVATETLESGLTIAVYADPVESARAAGLRWVSDDMPGR